MITQDSLDRIMSIPNPKISKQVWFTRAEVEQMLRHVHKGFDEEPPAITSYIIELKERKALVKPIENPKEVLESFRKDEPIYYNDGQFASGIETIAYEKEGMIYEFIVESGCFVEIYGNILEATTYPSAISRFK